MSGRRGKECGDDEEEEEGVWERGRSVRRREKKRNRVCGE